MKVAALTRSLRFSILFLLLTFTFERSNKKKAFPVFYGQRKIKQINVFFSHLPTGPCAILAKRSGNRSLNISCSSGMLCYRFRSSKAVKGSVGILKWFFSGWEKLWADNFSPKILKKQLFCTVFKVVPGGIKFALIHECLVLFNHVLSTGKKLP